jgi:hypothetical protein
MKKMHEIPFVAFLLAIKQTFPSTFLEQKYSIAYFARILALPPLHKSFLEPALRTNQFTNAVF